MQIVLYVIARVVQIVLGLLYTAMFFRAILSWFIQDPESKIMLFLAMVTEPFIIPVRVFLMRFEAIQRSPVDISFFVTFLLVATLRALLPTITL
jgi:YggT family protein